MKEHRTVFDVPDSWFLIETAGENILQISEVDDDGKPFETLDAIYTVYYGDLTE